VLEESKDSRQDSQAELSKEWLNLPPQSEVIGYQRNSEKWNWTKSSQSTGSVEGSNQMEEV